MKAAKNEQELFEFLVQNYVALKRGLLKEARFDSLNEIDCGWVQQVESELRETGLKIFNIMGLPLPDDEFKLVLMGLEATGFDSSLIAA